MRKRCLVLAFLLALTAVFPVHAVAATEMYSEIVCVTVPDTGRIVINPYGLPVDVDGGTTTEQIASDTMPIINHGDAPVVISASVAGRISEQSSMTFVTEPPPADCVEKEIFVYTEFQNRDSDWSGSYSNEENQLLVSEGASDTKEVLTLDANAEGKFRMFGATAVSPSDPWSSEDAISVTVVFTFAPVSAPVDATPVQDTEPAEEPPAEEPPAEEPPVEEPPAEEPPVEEPPAEEPPAEEPPAEEEPPVEEPPVEGPPTEDRPVEEPPVEEPPADSETEDTPTEDPPVTPEEPSPAPDSELPEEPEN